ncbi:lipopolysaccharide heptosyltransferase II [Helicobacter kayseriensis]|uniref:lipopolysaccharide heptosyltransferase II n=1 Tax=Helicobacter kayseriensis TaxID=2905877 RepID=UPI001E401218|nr:lipopolysaccharide heptosyltransferase II [Helicobacter kayseriensis]MCE3046855.1 lipopolysaccharide heptosyltransferase II [Helicobacter kayseriensis]MCE3047843.1 lipopolysaccharide heptosyltransferase II [Helicobacter kayseriensis]
MKILLRLPTWLGDAVMATPTIETLRSHYPQASFTFVGSPASIGIFDRPSQDHLIIDQTKQSKNRLWATYKLAQEIGKHDIAITFQNNLPSALLLFWTKSTQRIGYAKNLRSFLLTHALTPQPKLHQVNRYLHLLTPLSIPIPPHPKLHLKCHPHPKSQKIRIGINAGAKYGSAKRWCEAYFIEVIAYLLQKDYEVILYGGKDEIQANQRITSAISSLAPTHQLIDLTAKTSIPTLIDSIASLDLFLTNDSGPMHIASSLGIPLIAIFGPTDYKETSPYNTDSPQLILSKHLSCSPCMKRECPLKHHQCMKLITPDEVINRIEKLLDSRESKDEF